MTCKGMIEILKNYPEDTLLVWSLHSCYEDLPQPELILAIKKERAPWYEIYYSNQWVKEEKKPETINVLYFGGN